ncbi:Formylglycine-generating sulfatase enzyme [Planctomycetes bacterium MalM25]|nr:Formylglycine-generating sulfatase enzyme [Planctomycetes bacterium MalM25]
MLELIVMPLFPPFTGRSKGPFIGTQRLLRLIVPRKRPELARECLQPAHFRKARLSRNPGEPAEVQQLPRDCRWQPIRHARERLLVDATNDRKRICLLVDAGVGKTTAVQQTAYLRSVCRSGHLAMGFSFSELPTSHTDYLDSTQKWLVKQFKTLPETRSLDDGKVERLIRDKIRRGEFTLLADATDQRTEGQDTLAIARALQAFLGAYPNVSCVVSGRPKSIADCWESLFEHEPFEFVQVDCFTPEEAARYVGAERWGKIEQVGADFLSVPRMLEVVRKLHPDDLDNVRTEADLYWPAIEKSLEKMFSQQKTPLDRDAAERLLSLIAIELVQADGDPLEGVEGSDHFKRFTRKVYDKRVNQTDLRGDSPLYDYDSLAEFREAVLEVAKLNEGLECAVMDDVGEKQLYFRDMTLRDFFAALWCSRYATQEDLEWLSAHLHIRGEWVSHFAEELRHPFWRLLSGMPASAWEGNAWVASAGTLFVPPPDESAVRSTEMMHLAWPGLLRVAGRLPDRFTEPDVEQASTALQAEVFDPVKEEIIESWSPSEPYPTNPQEAALGVAQEFLKQFPRLLKGEGDAESQRIAHEFHVDWFKTKTVEAGPFAICVDRIFDARNDDIDPFHEGLIEMPFRMAKYPVTSELARLFDQSREARFDDYETFSSDPRCPAIYCTWYDAWTLALWLHTQLPTEQQWECACRGEEHRDEHLAFGWFEDESELGASAWCTESHGYERSTVVVDGTWDAAVSEEVRSPYGAAHLLGQVWEWASSAKPDATLSARDGSSQVLRGGSFDYGTGYCRAGVSRSCPPENCNCKVGIRLVRRS